MPKKCPICGLPVDWEPKIKSSDNQDTSEPCPECQQKLHKTATITFTFDYGSNILTPFEKELIEQKLKQLCLSRGCLLKSVEWSDTPKEDL